MHLKALTLLAMCCASVLASPVPQRAPDREMIDAISQARQESEERRLERELAPRTRDGRTYVTGPRRSLSGKEGGLFRPNSLNQGNTNYPVTAGGVMDFTTSVACKTPSTDAGWVGKAASHANCLSGRILGGVGGYWTWGHNRVLDAGRVLTTTGSSGSASRRGN